MRPCLPCAAARAMNVAAMADHSAGDSWAPLMRSTSAPARITSVAHFSVTCAASGAVSMMNT